MRRIISKIIVIIILALPLSLKAQRYDNGLIDKTIALIGNEAIFLSQLEQEIQMMQAQGIGTDKNTRCEVLENLLIQKLLLNQAKTDSLSADEGGVNIELEHRMGQILTQLGGEKEVEAYFKKPLHKIRQEWRNALREQNLTQQMQQTIMRDAGTSTPAEIETFYNNIAKDSLPIISTQYKLSQIVLYPNKEDAVLAVKQKLLDFRDRILKGDKFSTLASLYSEDPGSSIRGGELRMASKNMYWPAFSDAAMALKEGQISQIVETPDGFHIIQMIEKKGDMFNVRHILLKPHFTASDREKAFKKLDSIKTKILSDSLKFEIAAEMYSQDLKSSMNGGIMSDEHNGSTFFEKDQLKPMDYSIIKDLKEGEISDPFESTDNEGRSGNTIYKIIRLERVIPSHTANIKDDFIVIQNMANNKRQFNAISKFIKEKQKETFIRIDDLFKQCNFEREGWIK